MIAKARAKDLLTTPYVFNEGEAEAMAQRGRRHHRLPSRPDHRRRDRRADRARSYRTVPRSIDAWAAAARRVRPDILVLAHGGPIAEPADADFIMKNTQDVPRLLWRVVDGAPAGRTRADRAGA